MRVRMATTLLAVFAGVLAAVAVYAVAFAQNATDKLAVEMRTDLSQVRNSGDYIHTMSGESRPSRGAPDNTNAWLGIWVDPGAPSSSFAQVGLLGDSNGFYWFIFSMKQVVCLRGTPPPGWEGHGCRGANGDMVQLGSWHKVELVTYGQGFWIARVYNAQGGAVDLARIYSSSRSIYRANATFEEAFSNLPDPYLKGDYYHWHPQYWDWGTGGFRLWPASSGPGQNYLWTVTEPPGRENEVCPAHYSSYHHIGGDPRYWFTGTYGGDCYEDPMW